ncbi:cytochrome P450 monooxygenase pc-2 [Obba rivulosa]|uniref:Cytochrome P450 monooxygenase pc-2 n=1 Tax=Obba rivulosa TaxID=1052685 RepID=A0A8E2AWN0_9APHY|nr:cytochrome P450 monooxygenase pc-2 [Obba rivulosa]
MISRPPGVPFLLRCVLINSVPVLAVLASARTLRLFTGLSLPTWLLVVLAVLSIPLRFAIFTWSRWWRASRAAARLGATLVPHWKGDKVGNVDALQMILQDFSTGYIADSYWKATDKIGPTWQVELLWDPWVVTCDPAVIKTLLATDFQNFVKGETFQGCMHSVLGTGVFNSDGDMWKFHRGMTRPFFTREKINHFDLFDKHAGKSLQKLKQRLQAGHAVDFQDLLLRFTLDSSSEFLFGNCLDSLQNTLPYPHNVMSAASNSASSEAFSDAFKHALHAVGDRSRTGWTWPLLEITEDKTAEHMKVVDEFLQPILTEALMKQKRRAQAGSDAKESLKSEEEETLLDHLITMTTDPVVLHDEVLNILIAGRDTTASTLSFVVYLLCQHPEVLQRLRQEVLAIVGPTRMPTYEDMKDMKYLRAVLNETLRLYTPVPVNMRFSVSETTIPNSDPMGKPLYIPANTAVVYSPFVMHRRTEYWGPDAAIFDPDRFLDERMNKYLVPNPFIFLPFSAGPRICLGQQYAYNEMSFFIIRLLQQFSEMSLDSEAQPPESLPPAEWAQDSGRKAAEQIVPKVHLTMYIKGGLWLRMKEATHDE